MQKLWAHFKLWLVYDYCWKHVIPTDLYGGCDACDHEQRERWKNEQLYLKKIVGK